MSLDVELHFRKPIFRKGTLLTRNDFLLKEAGYGIPDFGNRLEKGKFGDGFFIVFHQEHPGRGFSVEHAPDFRYVTMSLNIPCTSADIHMFFATIGNKCADFFYYIFFSPAALSSADVRNYAIRAEIVTAVHNRYPSSVSALAADR